MRMNRRIKSAVSLFFSFMVTLALATGLLATVIWSGLCNPDVLIRAVNDSSYYDEKAELTTNRLSLRLKESGLPESIAKDVISDRNILVDMSLAVSNSLAGNTGYRVDTSQFERSLAEGIINYYSDNGVTVSEELELMTNEYVKEAASEYESLLGFGFAAYFMKYSEKYSAICKTVIYVSIAVILISVIMMLLVHRRKYRGLRYINYGLISGTILVIILNMLLKNKLTGIIAGSVDINSDIVADYLADSFSQGMYVCLFGVLLSVIMMIITLYMRKEAI